MINRDPLQAYATLPLPVKKWAWGEICLWQMAKGQDPNPAEFFDKQPRHIQWQIIALIVKNWRSNPSKKAAILNTVPARQLATDNHDNYFNPLDLVSIQHWDKYPHAAFFAPTGWGKDHNASALLSRAEGEVIACLIKEPERWQSACPKARIVCNGYNCAEIEQVLKDTVAENEGRVLGAAKTPLTIVFSDYPSIVKRIQGITEKYIADLLRDARSNRIRLWFLIQESNIAALDLEGRSELLENLTFVRGGKFAIAYAATLVKSKLLSVEEFRALNAMDRPTMIGNQLARF